MAAQDGAQAAPGPPAGSHYVARRPASGHLVALMDGGVEQRGFQLVGFDECHMPNHLNIVVYSPDWRGGRSRGLALGDPVSFEPPPSR
ncbi:MAG TPA: hypothetical protein VFE37_00370 [Chloroflexota bacterium]|nr:hypothetical protein [Chloroflexota bacterium]